MNSQGKQVRLKARHTTGEEVSCYIRQDKSIQELKKMITNSKHSNNITLVFNGKQLNDSDKIYEAGLKDDDTLIVCNNFSYQRPAEETVEIDKHLIADATGGEVPPDQSPTNKLQNILDLLISLQALQQQRQTINFESIQNIMTMGFTEEQALEALRRNNNNLDMAIEDLLLNENNREDFQPDPVMFVKLCNLGFEEDEVLDALKTQRNDQYRVIIQLCENRARRESRQMRYDEIFNIMRSLNS